MYELLIGHNESGEVWDVSNAVEDCEYQSSRSGSPGKFTFGMMKGKLNVSEGDVVRFSYNGKQIFYGWIFTITRDRYGYADFLCYDRLRYLKANNTYAFYDATAGEIIAKIAADLQLAVGTIEDTGYRIPSLITSEQACIDIIQDALNQTLLNTGRIYTLYDDGAGLALKYSGNWKSSYIFGDRSFMTDYTYKTDIDSDTYNYIKLVQPNESTGLNDVVIVYDSANMARWGLLQLYKSVDGGMNVAQMTEQAKETLRYYDRRKKTFSFDALGVPELRGGMLVRVSVADLGEEDINHYLLVESVRHKFSSGGYEMSVETVGYNYDTRGTE